MGQKTQDTRRQSEQRPPVLFSKLPLAQFVGLKNNFLNSETFRPSWRTLQRHHFQILFQRGSYTKGKPIPNTQWVLYIYLEIYNTLSVWAWVNQDSKLFCSLPNQASACPIHIANCAKFRPTVCVHRRYLNPDQVSDFEPVVFYGTCR